MDMASASNSEVERLVTNTLFCRQRALTWLYPPRHCGTDSGVEPLSEPAEAPRAEWGETVLVVDDEATVRMLVTEGLDDLGCESDTRIDLLVTDAGLASGMNGRQMADAAYVGRPGLKVLFITGYAENIVLSHGHPEPGVHVLAEAFDRRLWQPDQGPHPQQVEAHSGPETDLQGRFRAEVVLIAMDT